MVDLATVLQQGRASLLRYLPPYNPAQRRAVLEDAALQLLARLVLIRGLELGGHEQQLGPLVRGWLRIGRRRDLLSLLSGLASSLHRLYGGPILASSPLDRLECEPTPLEPLLSALLDDASKDQLSSPVCIAEAWEQAFGHGRRPPLDAARPLLDLLLPLGRRPVADDAPALLDLSAGSGGLLALAVPHLLQRAGVTAPKAGDLLSLLPVLRGYEPHAALRWGALVSLSLALTLPAAGARVRLPATLPVLPTPPAAQSDIALIRPRNLEEARGLLGAAPAALRPGGTLGLLLPEEAADLPAWQEFRRTVLDQWRLAALRREDSALVVVASPESDPARRDAGRILVGGQRAGRGFAVRQGALAALPGAPFDVSFTEPVERAVSKIAAGRPLAEVALIWRAAAGAPQPDRGAASVRATLPMLVVSPTPEGWEARLADSWPAEGGLIVQPLALLAAQRGAGVRLPAEERDALSAYTPALLGALLSSPLLKAFRRLHWRKQGPLSAAELRRLPVPLLAGSAAEEPADPDVARLYGLTADEVRVLQGS